MNEPKKAMFTMDCWDQKFEGLSFGYSWNGWSCPYFTKEIGLQISEVINEEKCHLTYSESKDCFVLHDLEEPDFDEDIMPQIINGKKYYSIGACSWCWTEISEEEV